MIRPGPRGVEVVLSLLAFVVTVALFFPGVTFEGRTVASCPHIPFVMPSGPIGLGVTREGDYRRPLHDPWGPGHIHEANFPYRDRAIRAGSLPWWQPHEACGNPYFAGLLPGLLYPPSYLMHLVGPTRGFDLTYLFRLVAAGWFLYLFLRVHRIRVVAAYGGGLALAFSGYFVTSMNLWNAGVECLIPGLFLAVEGLLARNRARHRIFAVVMVYLVLVAGNPESSFLALFFASTYGFARILNLPGPDGEITRRLLRMTVAFAVGALLALPQLLPFLFFLREAEHVHQAGVGAVHAPWQLGALWFAPDVFRDAYHGELALRSRWFYCGAIAPLLGVAAVSSHAPRFLKRFTLIALACVVAWYYGAPGISWLSLLPGFAQMFIVKYLAVYVCFFVAITAGLGLHCLARHRSRKSARVVAIGAAVIATVVGAWVLLRYRGAFDGVSTSELRLRADQPIAPLWHFPAALLAVALFLAMARRMAIRSAAAWTTALVVLLGFELYHYIPHEDYPPGGDPYRAPAFVAALEGDRRSFRIYAPDHVLSPNTAAAFRLNDVRYNEALKYGRYARMIASAFRYPDATNIFPTERGARPPVPVTALERMGVRYVLSQGAPCPLALPRKGPARREFACERAAGRIVRNAGGPAIRIGLRILDSGRVRARGALTDGAPMKLSAGELGPEERAYLLAPLAAKLSIRAVRWGGESLPLETLAASARVTLAPDRSLVVSPPAEIQLPFLPAGRPPLLEVTGRRLGPGSPTLVLASAGVRSLAVAAAGEALDIAIPRGTDRISIDRLAAPGAEGDGIDAPLEWRPRGLEPAGTFGGVRVAKLPGALPRAYGVYHAEVEADDRKALARWLDPRFPADRSVVLSAGTRPTTTADPSHHAPRVAWRSESAGGDRLSFDVDFDTAGYFVLLDNHGAGWRATVDGDERPIIRANYTFRAVEVGAGRHRVRFHYTPPGLIAGLGAALAGLAIGIWFAVSRRWRSRRPRAHV